MPSPQPRPAAWARLLLHLSRTYIAHAPILLGKTRLARLAETHLLPRLPANLSVMVRSADGRRFRVEVHDPNAFHLMMWSHYDPYESDLVRRLVRSGDICADIGANDGWYTTLFALLVGPSGRVHAFEPVPATRVILQENCERNGFGDRVIVNALALSDRSGEEVLFVPAHRGGASLRQDPAGGGEMMPCRLTTLDEYCRSAGVREFRFIKCDVEGAEKAVIQGAHELLSAERPPLWLLELHRGTAARFGYRPADLLELLSGYGYVFHLVNRYGGPLLRPLGDFEAFVDADNVLCSVPAADADVGDLIRRGVRCGP
jgi:FkbM family methyltransferase